MPRPSLGRSARWDGAAVLALYLLLALAYFGRFAMASPAGGTIGTGPDIQIFLWGLRWWPFAVVHGLNPLVSHVVWPPYGTDVLWTTTVPAVSLLFAPVTLTLGPVVTWNLLCVLAPALAGWAAYLVCRELTGRLLPSAVGGALFGFSSYQLAEGIAHLQLSMSLCVPLAVWLAIRHFHGRLDGRGLAVRLAVLLVIEFLISPEILATMLFFAVLVGAGAFVLLPQARTALRATLKWAGIGALAAGLVLSPLVVLMVRHTPGQFAGTGLGYSIDLENLILPTRVTALGHHWAAPLARHFAGNLAEQGAYLGIPLLAMVVCFAVARRSSPAARLLLFSLVATLVLSFGPRLTIGGHQTIWMPAALLGRFPLLANALPARFILYTSLATSIVAALWLANSRSYRAIRWGIAALAIVCLVPSSQAAGLWWAPMPKAIASGKLRRALPRGSHVLSLPFWNLADRSIYAQVNANMKFDLIDGWIQTMPAQYERVSGFTGALWAFELSALRGHARVHAFERTLCRLHISHVVVWGYSPRLLAGLKLHPLRAGNALVYRLPRCTVSAAPLSVDWRLLPAGEGTTG